MSKPVAIVVGASRGMGAAIAQELYNRGYSLSTMSTSGESAFANDSNVLSLKGSVLNPQDLERLVAVTREKFGRIDVVANSTGHPAQGDLLDISDQAWHDGLDMVFLNVVRIARLVTPIFLQQGSGSMVNIASFSAVEPSLDYPVSSALRAGLANFCKMYADRYAENNIRMNNLLPGFIESYEIDESIQQAIPMQRSGKLSEIAKTAAFLLSDDAGYITGQSIRVDGGLTRSF